MKVEIIDGTTNKEGKGNRKTFYIKTKREALRADRGH